MNPSMLRFLRKNNGELVLQKMEFRPLPYWPNMTQEEMDLIVKKEWVWVDVPVVKEEAKSYHELHKKMFPENFGDEI